ncbi:hypothetical protein D3C78_1405680 [compost metagenome]
MTAKRQERAERDDRQIDDQHADHGDALQLGVHYIFLIMNMQHRLQSACKLVDHGLLQVKALDDPLRLDRLLNIACE